MSDRVTPCECRVYLSRRGLLHDEYAASASVIKCDRCKASVNAHDRLTRENAKMREALKKALTCGLNSDVRTLVKAALAAEGEE